MGKKIAHQIAILVFKADDKNNFEEIPKFLLSTAFDG